MWETIAGLCRTYMSSVPSARATVQRFIALNDLKFVGIGEREFDLATQAYAEFGKGRHPAALNMGDCFAYACAKANRAKLLFKGEDFTKTDIGRRRVKRRPTASAAAASPCNRRTPGSSSAPATPPRHT